MVTAGELTAGTRLPTQGTVRLIGAEAEALEPRFAALGFAVARGPADERDEAPDYDLLVDTTRSRELRRALEQGLPYLSTREAAEWSLRAIEARQRSELRVNALQDLWPVAQQVS